MVNKYIFNCFLNSFTNTGKTCCLNKFVTHFCFRLFLIGLEKYGKGDWRSISRNAVVSRTPTQVASHAQKYFLRMNSVRKDKKRSSIHDITTVDADAGSSSQSYDPSWVGPLTDQLETHQLGSPSDFNDQGRSIGGYHSFGFPM